jgi:purine-binding chemotaxis protein CheW
MNSVPDYSPADHSSAEHRLPDHSSVGQTPLYVTFRLAHTPMAISILDVREIVPRIKITQVHQAPDFVMGLINLRGRILTVLDLGLLLGLEQDSPPFPGHIIIFKHWDLGFAVDRIGDMISIDPDLIESLPANMDDRIRNTMDGIANGPKEALIILNAQKILAASQIPGESP